MSRSQLFFACEGAELAATIDAAPGSTGLLIVSGGNEIRSGTQDGMAQLAARIAAHGYPVMRFDRRGVGDSGGANGGFLSSAPDIAAALRCFRVQQPQLDRIIGLGNCDAASALALFRTELSLDHSVLTNPWLFDGPDAAPSPSVVRARYRDRLRSLRFYRDLINGRIALGKAVRGLQVAKAKAQPSELADRICAALATQPAGATILLAQRDATARAFWAQWESPWWQDVRRLLAGQVQVRDTASHSFAGPGDGDWLAAQLLAILRHSNA